MNIKSKVPSAPKEESNGWDLAHLVGQLIDHRWVIVAVTALFMLLGTLYSLFATPIYSADAMVQVEDKNSNTVLNDLTQMMPNAQPMSATEVEIVTSRMVVGKTVHDLGLDVLVQQNYLPVIGKGLSRIMGNKPGQLEIPQLTVPTDWEKRELEVEVNGPDSYTVSKDGKELFKGKVGQLENHNGVTMLVSGIQQVDKGTDFTVTKLSDLQAIKLVTDNLAVADKGKDTGVLGLTYTGEYPVLISKVLNQLIDNYVGQNIDRKSAEAQKSLEFLKVQLPDVREKLDAAEDKLNRYRRQNDSVDMSLEAKSALDSSVSIQSQLNELTFKEAEVSQLFTKDHPTYRALLEKRQTLENQQKQLNQKIGQMPQTQQEIVRLTRDVQSGQEIYMQLLNRQQELNISKASTVGDVRVVDHAETAGSPVAPKKMLLILASMILGLVVSVGYILLKALFHHGIDSPDQLEEQGMNVYASVPLSEWQRKKDTEALTKRGLGKTDPHNTLLALGNPTDLSIEAIRSLRTSLHFAMMEAKNNILMITGASPGIGKTFICSNLATLVAKAGQKVLFIDGDMRRGYTHELLGASSKTGLSNILSGKTPFTTELIQQGAYGFDFLPRGQVPPNPSELLMHNRMQELLAWASKNYDLVLIDTPPILAVTDASVIGKMAGTSLMVARFETNTLKELDISYKRFAQNGIEIKGVILNAVVRKAANAYGYGYDYYDYSYKQDAKS